MTPLTDPTNTDLLLAAKITVPQHVVYRSFPTETVVLNLNTGKYHGLNATAGKMLDTLKATDSVRDAAAVLADTYEQPQSVIEQDLCDLCRSLLERGLIDTDGSPAP